MSKVTLLPAAGRALVPWKNGGGVTQTVAAHPDGAGPDAFLWRVSIAEVRTAGPFSTFAQTNRHLSVLEGILALSIAGETPAEVTPHTPGLPFPGDVAASGTPVGGPVLDLNVMTRRGHFRAEVEKLYPGEAARISADVAILVATAPTQVEYRQSSTSLDRLDALSVLNDVGETLLITAGGPAQLIQIFHQDRFGELGQTPAAAPAIG